MANVTAEQWERALDIVEAKHRGFRDDGTVPIGMAAIALGALREVREEARAIAEREDSGESPVA